MKYVRYRIRSGYMSNLLMLISRLTCKVGRKEARRRCVAHYFCLKLTYLWPMFFLILYPMKTPENSCVFYDFLNGNIGHWSKKG